jgi:nucleoside-diphosphate-sugar epimerase
VRVLLAGATSAFGKPLADHLMREGHDVIGLTRSRGKAAELERRGIGTMVADVFDRDALTKGFAIAAPDAVVSLLITLPKNGPRRPSQVHPNLPLWGTGVPNLIEAARDTGVRRFVAESFVFAYGYGQYGPDPLSEDDVPGETGVIDGQAEIVEALRRMELAVVGADGVEGIALRFGGRHGASLPMRITMARALRCRVPVLPGGGHALLPFIELSDSMRAVSAALSRGSGGEIYNIVDDEPAEMREYAAALAGAIGAPPPKSIPLWMVKGVAPYMACVLDHTRLPVSNEKAKLALNWEPQYPTIRDAFTADIA